MLGALLEAYMEAPEKEPTPEWKHFALSLPSPVKEKKKMNHAGGLP